MTMPTFIGVGTARSGSTAMYSHLSEHPEVFMSGIKETKFFSCEGEPPIFSGPGDAYWKDAITDLNDYQKSYDRLGNEKAIGEVTPLYLLYPHSAKRIHRYVPEARIFAIFRNPVDRAFSHFAVNWMRKEETVDDFMDAVRLEGHRIKEGWSPKYQYTRWGFYFEQWKRYVDLFPPRQLRIYLYDDFRDDPVSVMQDLYSFIGVDSNFHPNTDPINSWKTASKSLRRSDMGYIINWVRTGLTTERRPPILTASTKSKLMNLYRDDILRFQDLICRDLGAWISAT